MKKYTLLAALAFSALTVTATPKENTSQGNPQEMDKFITELMGKMTLHEKIGQLNLPVTGNIVTGQAKSSDVAGKIRNGEVGGLFNLKGVKNIREVQKLAVENSRLGIPLLFGMDVIHGYETVFPIPLALSCSWDMEAIEKSARIAAIESSADGICWTFSPMVDICRDARWGRVSEGNGEDPFLGSAIAQAMIRGYQGKDMSANNEIMACVKHFALYGAGEAGRDYNTVDMSRNRMFNEYFPPYKAAVEAGVGSAMTSFNEIDGVPATANHWLLTDVLRNQWGFDGFVVTDYTAISEMIDHGIGEACRKRSVHSRTPFHRPPDCHRDIRTAEEPGQSAALATQRQYRLDWPACQHPCQHAGHLECGSHSRQIQHPAGRFQEFCRLQGQHSLCTRQQPDVRCRLPDTRHDVRP